MHEGSVLVMEGVWSGVANMSLSVSSSTGLLYH